MKGLLFAQLYFYSVSGAGDVDGDGCDDLIFGNPGDFTNGFGAGSARVFSGKTGRRLHVFFGDAEGDHFGHSVSGAGDVDGDGYADLVVGARDARDKNGLPTGSAKVLSGRSGEVIRVVYGDSSGDAFGFSVGGAGDVDGDGFDDVIVGARMDERNSTDTDSGSAHVYSGKTGAVLYTFRGDSAADHLGSSVDGAGDVNSDGYADLVVGASSGYARVFSGKDGATIHSWSGDAPGIGFGRTVGGAGDVDNDGVDDLVVGALGADRNGVDSGTVQVFSGKTGGILHEFHGESAGDYFGRSVSGAGDVDGDGFDDLIVGAPFSATNGSASGSARVFSGRTGVVLRSFHGDSAGDFLGHAVSAAGDVDGDGFGDVVFNRASYERADVISHGFTGTPATERLFGAACPASTGNLPHVDYRGRTGIGQSIEVLLRASLPSTPAWFVLGEPADVDLGSQLPGLAGCRSYVSEVIALIPRTSDPLGMASSGAIGIPNQASLIGWRLNAQWACLDDAANSFGAVTTNGLALRVGN